MIIPKKLFGIIGWPIGHSLSPLVHNAAFQELELPCAYFAWQIPPDGLSGFIQATRLLEIMGCSVTIPHKITVIPMLDSLAEPARICGAVNTIVWRDGGLHGENTDIAGFMAPLKDIRVEEMEILLLGAGGAAHAAAAGLFLRHCEKVQITSPGNVRQFQLAEKFGFKAIAWDDRYKHEAALVINATPIGMTGKLAGKTPYDFARQPPGGSIAYDLVYNPLETRFLAEAAAKGLKTISGLEMFYWQADAQFRLWTGLTLPEKSRKILETALEKA